MYIDFEYAGKRLSDFGYTICKFGGSSDLTDVEIGCDITFSTVKNNHSSIHYNTSSSYENVYTTSLEIMKDPCNKNQDEMYHINEEISMLTSWLNRREYHKFKPLTEEDNLYSVHYYGSFNVKEKTINDRVVGFVLSFTGSAPYGFGEQIVNEIDMNCNDVTASGTILSITDSAEAKPNIKTFGKSKQNGTPSLDTQVDIIPIGEAGSVRHTLFGFNLLDESTATVDSSNTNYSVIERLMPNYDIFTISQGVVANLFVYQLNANNVIIDKQEIYGMKEFTFSPVENATKLRVRYDNANNSGTMMMNYGDSVLPYSPYVEEQTITLQTPNGLHGIPLGATIPDAIKNSPIHMSGVYWDEVEQQYYISDTKNENGKDVQRIRQVAISSAKYTDDMSIYMGALSTVACFRIAHDVFRSIKETPVMCNKLINKRTWNRDYEACYHTEANGVDINIKYETLGITSDATSDERVLAVRAWLENNELVLCDILAEPIITDVSEEDQAQYDSIHMNCPNTTIVNDAGAYMEVTYLQDYDNEIVICGVSDEYGTLYPNISITCKQDGDLRIKNTITGNVFEVLNCSEGETIYVNGEHKFIDSDNEKHKNSTLFNDFNYEYLKLQVEDNDFNENVFEVSLPCAITVGYYPIRKVGM